jgi:hypothetical protein
MPVVVTATMIIVVMAMPVAPSAAMEVVKVVVLEMLTPMRIGAMVAVAWVIVAINVPMEMVRTMKPRTCADEHAAVKPLRAIVTVGAQL